MREKAGNNDKLSKTILKLATAKGTATKTNERLTEMKSKEKNNTLTPEELKRYDKTLLNREAAHLRHKAAVAVLERRIADLETGGDMDISSHSDGEREASRKREKSLGGNSTGSESRAKKRAYLFHFPHSRFPRQFFYIPELIS